MEEKRTYLGSMDIFKFVASFLVIAIHTGPFFEYNEIVTFFIVRVFARLAVPYFFMCAGFFFVVKSKARTPEIYLKKYIANIIILYFVWSIVYLFDEFPRILSLSKNLVSALGLYVWRFIFIGSYYHLWFLVALMIAVCLLYLSVVNNRIGTFLIVSFILYIIGLFGDSYYGLLPSGDIKVFVDGYLKIFETTRNGLFFGCFYVALGGYIATSRKFLSNYILYDDHGNLEEIEEGVENRVIALFTISLILLSAEALYLELNHIGRDYNMYVMLIPATLCLFLLIKEFNIYLTKTTSIKIREYSMVIYFIHPLFILLVKWICVKLGLVNVYTLEFLLVCVFSVISVGVLYKVGDIFIETREN